MLQKRTTFCRCERQTGSLLLCIVIVPFDLTMCSACSNHTTHVKSCKMSPESSGQLQRCIVFVKLVLVAAGEDRAVLDRRLGAVGCHALCDEHSTERAEIRLRRANIENHEPESRSGYCKSHVRVCIELLNSRTRAVIKGYRISR